MKSLIINFLLLIIAILLFFPLTGINLLIVLFHNFKFKSLLNRLSGYFLSTATNIDKFANHEFRKLWNLTLVKRNAKIYHKFGVFEETISYAMALNKDLKSNSKFAIFIEKIINIFDKDHLKKTKDLYELKKLKLK